MLHPPYSPHPSIEYALNCIRSLERRSGMSLADWIERAKSGPEDEEWRRAWLKESEGLGTNFAWWIAERSYGRGEEDIDPDAYLRKAPEYVDAMYSGPKASLRPIHDAIIRLGSALGVDVRICPCQTMVPLYRNHVFAQIKPAARMRIDLGLCLRGQEPTGRLQSTGGEAKGDRITHRIAISSVEEVDADVAAWLRAAYEKDC